MHEDWLDRLSDSFGGTEKLRQAAGVGRTALANWRRRGFVPSKHWAKLAAHAAANNIAGISLDTLASINAPSSQFVNSNSEKTGCHPAMQHARKLAS